MKKKEYTALGLMSGTSMDGVDLSVIKSDGYHDYTSILDRYFKYDDNLHKLLTNLRDDIRCLDDIQTHKNEIENLEKKITFFHAQIVNEEIKKNSLSIDFLGFHGQTIYHSAKEKVSKQLGDGLLLSQLTKKKVVYNFRQNDILHEGEGAPLTPIFHQMLSKKYNLNNSCFINIGGILNSTKLNGENLFATDHGPGMCLIDEWVRKNTKDRFDKDGTLAKSGKINKQILEQGFENFFEIESNKKFSKSFDIKDFSIAFVKGLSVEDGVSTLVELTAKIIHKILDECQNSNISKKIFFCGGGRKNKFLIERVKKYSNNFQLIDDLGIDGDFIESQAFAYLSIRSILKLPISFPETTGCKMPCTGGVAVKNY